jgi:hypothetical protein
MFTPPLSQAVKENRTSSHASSTPENAGNTRNQKPITSTPCRAGSTANNWLIRKSLQGVISPHYYVENCSKKLFNLNPE